MNMFIASFTTVNSTKFKPNRHGVYPVIGSVQAGVATASLMDGTMFQRNGYTVGTLYLCKNVIDPEYPDSPRVEIISSVSPLELIASMATLGPGRLERMVEEPVVEEPIIEELPKAAKK